MDKARFERGLAKCLANAGTSHTPELQETWQTLADSYRCLLEHCEHELTFKSWQRNNTIIFHD